MVSSLDESVAFSNIIHPQVYVKSEYHIKAMISSLDKSVAFFNIIHPQINSNMSFAIIYHNRWIRIWAMLSSITMDELEYELCYQKSQWMNKNMSYAIKNHNGWIRIWAMLSSITMDELEYELCYHQSQWMN